MRGSQQSHSDIHALTASHECRCRTST